MRTTIPWSCDSCDAAAVSGVFLVQARTSRRDAGLSGRVRFDKLLIDRSLAQAIWAHPNWLYYIQHFGFLSPISHFIVIVSYSFRYAFKKERF